MLLNLRHNHHLPRDTIQPFDYHGVPLDVLDDLSSRFIINLPQHERENIIRAMFQIEQAHWFYKDFLCAQRPGLVPLQFRSFARIMFNHVPFLKIFLKEFDSLLEKWKEYKSNVPTYGAILLDENWDQVLMVQGFCSNSWGFPKGKVNAEEDPVLCAVREVKEETGFDCNQLINKNDFIELKIRDTNVRLYIVPGVKLTEKFQTQTRGEIKDIKWFPLNRLPIHKNDKEFNPNAFFMAIPFIKHLKRWIQEQKRNSRHGHEFTEQRKNGCKNSTRSASESDSGHSNGLSNGHVNGNGYTNGYGNGNESGHKNGRSRTPKSVKKRNQNQANIKYPNTPQNTMNTDLAHRNETKYTPTLSCKLGAKSWENFDIEWDKIWAQLLSEA